MGEEGRNSGFAFPGITAETWAARGLCPACVHCCMCVQSEQEPMSSLRMDVDRGPAVWPALCWAQG